MTRIVRLRTINTITIHIQTYAYVGTWPRNPDVTVVVGDGSDVRNPLLALGCRLVEFIDRISKLIRGCIYEYVLNTFQMGQTVDGYRISIFKLAASVSRRAFRRISTITGTVWQRQQQARL